MSVCPNAPQRHDQFCYVIVIMIVMLAVLHTAPCQCSQRFLSPPLVSAQDLFRNDHRSRHKLCTTHPAIESGPDADRSICGQSTWCSIWLIQLILKCYTAMNVLCRGTNASGVGGHLRTTLPSETFTTIPKPNPNLKRVLVLSAGNRWQGRQTRN